MFPAADTLVPVARVLKSYGTVGEVMISFPADMSEYLSTNEEPVFLFYDGLPVPFFIESFAARGPRKAVVSLTGIRSQELAEEIVGRDLFLDPARHPELQEEGVLLPGSEEYGLTLEDLIGFTILNADVPSDASSGAPSGVCYHADRTSSSHTDTCPDSAITDSCHGCNPIGRIVSVSDYSGNICFELEDGTLLPYHDDLLAGIDPEARTITLHIPDGLLA